MKAVILAGGKGTRLGLRTLPKPMVSIGGMPLIGRQVLLAKRYGIRDIFVLSGHISGKIVDYLGNGGKFGVNIGHVVENKPLGTAGALKQLENRLKTDFFVFYGDTMLDVDLRHMAEVHRQRAPMATVLSHPNDHPSDSDLLKTDGAGYITRFYPKPHDTREYLPNLVSAALYILSPKIFRHIGAGGKKDICRDIFPALLEKRAKIFAYKSAEYIKDIGTAERLKKVRKDYSNGAVAARNRALKQKAVFLDRDGVINRDKERVSGVNDVRLYGDAYPAIRLINSSGLLCVVATNQPVIAKGFCTVPGLEQVHNKIETLLGKKGCYLDAIYYCPHHPHKGFKGEVKSLKTDCGCRKPKPGMIVSAMRDFNIGAGGSFIIGDRDADILAGKAAGIGTVLLRRAAAKHSARTTAGPDFTAGNFVSAVKRILKAQKNDNN